MKKRKITNKIGKIGSVALALMIGFGVALPISGAKPAYAGEVDISSVGGKVIHIDAQAIDAGDNTPVGSVNNTGTLGNLIQNDTNRMPDYVKNSTLSDLPALRFAADSYLTVEGSSSAHLEDMTIFVVANAFSLPSHGELVSRVNGAPYNHNWFLNIEGGLLNYGWGVQLPNGIAYPQNKLSIAANQPVVITAEKKGEHGIIYLNGVVASAFLGAATPCNPANTAITVGGAADSFIGDIGEIIVYDRGLSESEVLLVEQYLEERWKLQNLHDGMLRDISVKGESLPFFRFDKTEYSVLDDEEITINDIACTKWNNDDNVTVKKTDAGFAIEVTSAITGQIKTYKVEIKKMQYNFNEIKKIGSNEVKINQGYWSGLYRQYSVRTVNFMFDMFDKSKSFDNFDRVANGEKRVLNNTSQYAGQIMTPNNDRDVYNTDWRWVSEPWREGLIYEGIRAASQFIMVNRQDASYKEDVDALAERLDAYVGRIYAAALKTTAKDRNGKPIDGYFSTYNILTDTGVADESDVSGRWHHDVYNYGCLAEAAVYYYNATGDTRLLFAATRFTEFLIDYINGRDGYQGYKLVPPHELPEEALQRLYDLYSDNPELVKLMETRYSRANGISPADRYYELEIRLDEYAKIAASWITDRGNAEGRYNYTNGGNYMQDNVVYSEMTEATGHAVRANLWYNGIAYIGNRQERLDFVAAAERIWNNIVYSQMYVTGGTGSTNDGEEAYGGNNQLPHNGYCETCASVGMAFFSQNMFNIFGEGKYADNVELEMYNGILGCLGLDGTSFYYTNPMVSDNYTRPMFSNATPCCVPMYLKFFSELPEIIYAGTDSAVFVNQYISSSLETFLGDNKVTVVQGTDMPNGNMAMFSVSTAAPITLKLRVPSWANGVKLTVNGEPRTAIAGDDDYIDVTVEGKAEIKIEFLKEVLFLKQDYAQANVGMVAVRYGSFVYCAEQADNAMFTQTDFSVLTGVPATVSYTENLFAYQQSANTRVDLGVNLIKLQAQSDGGNYDLTLVPFCLRGNRKQGYMTVWFKEA